MNVGKTNKNDAMKSSMLELCFRSASYDFAPQQALSLLHLLKNGHKSFK